MRNSITSEELPTPISSTAAEQIEDRLKAYRARAFIIADEGRSEKSDSGQKNARLQSCSIPLWGVGNWNPYTKHPNRAYHRRPGI